MARVRTVVLSNLTDQESHREDKLHHLRPTFPSYSDANRQNRSRRMGTGRAGLNYTRRERSHTWLPDQEGLKLTSLGFPLISRSLLSLYDLGSQALFFA